MHNPDLASSSAVAPAAVAPLGTGVHREPGAPPPQAPIPNTLVDTSRYFFCPVPSASMHRKDGKRLPFIAGLLKTSVKEDIEFLDAEIASGNIYIRKATPDEVEHAKLLEDPMGAVREAVKAEVVNNFSVEELEALLAQRRAVGSGKPAGDAGKLAGVDVNAAASAALRAQGVTTHAAATGANTLNLAGLIKKS